jgi:hypothetical protein
VGLFGKGRRSILKEGFLPLIKLRRVDLMPLADLRDGLALQQMLPQNFDFFLRRIVPATVRIFVVVHALFLLAEK